MGEVWESVEGVGSGLAEDERKLKLAEGWKLVT